MLNRIGYTVTPAL